MIRRPPRSTRVRSSAASDVYKRQAKQMGQTVLPEKFTKNNNRRLGLMVEWNSMAQQDRFFLSQRQNSLATTNWRNAKRMRKAGRLYVCILRCLCKAVTKASCRRIVSLRTLERDEYWMKSECMALRKTSSEKCFLHTGLQMKRQTMLKHRARAIRQILALLLPDVLLVRR